MTGESISVRTVHRALKKAGMKAVVKKKRPKLTKRHRRERMDFALAHKEWTVEDWKRVGILPGEGLFEVPDYDTYHMSGAGQH
jgi:hypothetical protein